MRTGSFVALVTLFDDDGEVDLAATRAHVERVVAAGSDGVLVCGSTGEFPALDEDERMAVAEAAIAQAGGRIAVGVHVGTPATRSTARLARHAAAAGADALAAVTPYYLKTDGAGLASHLEAVKEAAPDVPLLAYSIGRLAGYEHPVDVLGDLAARGVLQGVKESGDDLGRLVAIREACGPGFAIFAGSPHLQAACLAHGASGSILGLANAAPAECARVARLAEAGDHGAAAALAARLRPAAAAAALGSAPAGVKALCALRFGTSPHPRAPRHALSPAERERALAGLRAAGLDAPVAVAAD
jgi:4-hydroxy-tetrahydrodipicolinate synthase